MKTSDIETFLHSIKPDGHGNFSLANALHRMANEVQLMADKTHAVITTVTSPQFKGDVTGELAPWPGHFPLELDHSGQFLNDITVRGASVSEHLDGALWNQAEEYLKERFSPEITESTRKIVERMDKADLREARNA